MLKHRANKYLAAMAAPSSPGTVAGTKFDRSCYTTAYLLQCVPEATVQAAVLAELHRLGITAWVVDAGAKLLRGRAFGAMRRAGVFAQDAAAAMKGKTGAGFAGLPDIAGYLPGGRSLFVEVKAPLWLEACDNQLFNHGPKGGYRQLRPAGKLSPQQLEFLTAASAAGCCAGVVWGVTDLARILPEPW